VTVWIMYASHKKISLTLISPGSGNPEGSVKNGNLKIVKNKMALEREWFVQGGWSSHSSFNPWITEL
jgi:hypothetical protein